MFRSLAAMLFCATAAGCATIDTVAITKETPDHDRKPRGAYSGVREDAMLTGYTMGLSLIDLPLSLVADTLVLPYTLTHDFSSTAKPAPPATP